MEKDAIIAKRITASAFSESTMDMGKIVGYAEGHLACDTNDRVQRIARMLVAFNRNELEKQLKRKRSDLDEKSFNEHLDCLDEMDAKEQKVALYWIGKKTLTLPEDLSKFNNAMNLINKQHLDFQKFDDPMDVLSRDDKSTLKIRSQDEVFNPSTEKTFSHPYNAGDGVVIYNVEDSKEGQKAVRRATDFYFGYDKNFWCLAARKEGFRQDEINALTPEQAEKLGFYSDDALAVAWNHWKGNSAYPKRIAFKNGKLFAFSAGYEKQHVEWWDRNDDSHYYIPESNAVDDIEFLKKYGKINLLENNNASPEIIDELAEDEDWRVRKEVAKNSRAPVEALRKFTEDKNVWVRKEVAKNPRTPAEILMKLAEDENGLVRMEVVDNPKAPVELLRKLAEDGEEYVRRELVENPNTPVDILMRLTADENKDVRKEVARNPRTPVETLRKLAEDGDKYVKEAVTNNPNTPVDILTKLAEDEDKMVRQQIAKRLRTPVEALRKLVEDEDANVRYEVAKHPNTPVELLTKLAEDKNEGVRYAVIRNPRTPAEALMKMAGDRSFGIRYELAKNPRTPTEVLMRLAEDEDEEVRYAVANNPRTPVEALRKLADDKNWGVSQSAKNQLY